MKDKTPAFPIINNDTVYESGMDLRDYFAAKALQGILSNPEMFNMLNGQASKIASHLSYDIADFMMAQRNIETE